MTSSTASNRIARVVLASSSWMAIATVAIGFLGTIPAFTQTFESAPPGSGLYVLGKVIAVLAGASLFGAWIGGIWHAATSSAFKSDGHKVVVICFLAIGFAIGSIAYYFTSVIWQRPFGHPAT